MDQTNCIFCKIVRKELPSTVVFESELSLAFKDIHPKAPIHYLVIPKVHIQHLGTSDGSQLPYILDTVHTLQQLALQLPHGQGFNIVANNGASAGQVVPHLHWHLLSGKNIYDPECSFKL